MEHPERTEEHNLSETQDLLFALAGAAMVLFGAGLMLSHPLVRRYLAGLGLGDLAKGAIPDIERYLKLRGM